MSVHVQWIGNAFFTIRTGDKLIFTDPWVTNNPGAALTVEEAAGMAPTHVWVSHGHPGHYGRGDSVQIANLSRSTYYSTKEVIRYVQDRDLLHTRYLGFEPGSRLLADGVDVEVFSVAHPPEPPVAPEWRDLPGAPNTISVFQTGGRTLLHVGDTMPDPAYDDIAERYQIDLAMLPLWGKGMGSDEATAIATMIQIIEKIKPTYVMFHNRWDPERPAWSAFFRAIEGRTLPTVFCDQHPGVSIDL